MSFEKLGLREELVRAAEELGFETPMPIQKKAIPALLTGERDFVGLAQTGTGKTGAFGLAMMQMIDSSVRAPQGVVICPTRELCLQITDDLKKFGKHMTDVSVVAVYGGASITNQTRQLRDGAQIVVATPGRMLDLIDRKAVRLSQVSYAVLDEADEMLNMGFQEDIDSILGNMPDHRRIWLFSATMPAGVAAIARNYLKDPVEVTIGTKNHSPANISHSCYVIQEKDRYESLKRMIDFTPDMFALVFCRTRQETQTVAESLMKDGYQAEAIHGDLSQAQRDYVMRKFRHRTIRILVATDVAARGLDVADITHVIHYKLPDEAEIYTHRSGRTARAGKSGDSIVFVNRREIRRIEELEKRGNIRFKYGKIPNGKSICERQLFGMVDKIVNTEVNHEAIADYLPAVYNALCALDKEELIRRLVAAEFERFFRDYGHVEDIKTDTFREPEAFSKSAKRKKFFQEKSTRRFKADSGRPDKKAAYKKKYHKGESRKAA